MKNQCHLLLQYLLPQHCVSRVAGKIARCRIVWLKNWLIKKFIAYYQVNMEEAVTPSVESYPDFNSFFTRALKPNARPITATEHDAISPVDGCISQMGEISNNILVQAKGKDYTLQQLLVLPELGEIFNDGSFATFYLSPRDYHRIHMPLTGKLRKMIYIPGTLFAVNNSTVRNIPYLFGRNERVVTIFDTAIGAMALVLVGAMIVGSISTTWSNIITPSTTTSKNRNSGYDSNNRNDKDYKYDGNPQIWSYADTNIVLQRGDEMGRFQLGSTVILLFQKNALQWLNILALNEPIKMGQIIGNTILPNNVIFQNK